MIPPITKVSDVLSLASFGLLVTFLGETRAIAQDLDRVEIAQVCLNGILYGDISSDGRLLPQSEAN